MNTNVVKLLRVVLAPFIGSLIFCACQKSPDETLDDECKINVKSIAGNYKLSSLTYKLAPSAPPQDYMIFFDDCEKDDVVFLSTNGTYTYKDQGTVCDPKGDDSGTWSLKGNTLTSDGVINGDIESFDCKTLVYALPDLYVEGDKMIFVMTKQ
jgi:hypothetical protein